MAMQDVSGAFRPHVLTALVGASGAGKTTLMDVLAGRKTGGKIEGDIRINVRLSLTLCSDSDSIISHKRCWSAKSFSPETSHSAGK